MIYYIQVISKYVEWSDFMKKSPVEVWLWLLLVMNPHNPKTLALLEHFGSADTLARAIRDGECEGLSDSEKQRAVNTRTREVRQIMEECAAQNIRIITLDDTEYPSLLKNIYSPPIVLFVRGSLNCLNEAVSLAVVGPRRPSEYAVRAGEKLCTELVKLGTVLVSGLAVGIDTVAHTCAVRAGAPTIGVLACGQLVNYPAENEELKKRIVECGGAVISELLPHASVDSGYFQQRNRMISGLGMGTLIVEASTRSGCLLTANHAIDQGRDLFCVPPGDITRESCMGVVPYLRDGAIPVFDHLDIVKEYMCYFFSRIDVDELNDRYHRNSARKQAAKQERRYINARVKPSVQPESTSSVNDPVPEEIMAVPDDKLNGLPEIQINLVKMVEKSPSTVDELLELSGMSYARAIEALTELEIAGLIQLMPDGKYHIV